MHVIVICPLPNINNVLETRRSWVQISYRPKYFLGLIFTTAYVVFNTAKITFKFISDTDTILRVCTWLQITDILVKSVVNIHFVFASYEEKNTFSVANTVLNSTAMLVCFSLSENSDKAKLSMSRYTFSTPSLEGSFSMSSYSTFSASSFPKKDEMENDEHDLTSAIKTSDTKTKTQS